MEQLRSSFLNALLTLDQRTAMGLALEFDDNRDSYEFVEEIMTPALNRIGDGWSNGEYALSQVYMSGRICEQIMERILPDSREVSEKHPKIAITTYNDFHLLGKRIVGSMLRAARYSLEDFGRTETKELIQRTIDEKIDILLISTLMLNSAIGVGSVVEGLKKANSDTKVVVGGAVFRFDKSLWKEVGAHAMGETASDAIKIVASLNGSG
jgi:methanogenic corrinoid protein MtbC1